MSRPKGRAPSPEVLDKERAVVALRRQGYTWDEIAAQVGYRHASGAAQAYERACARIIADDVLAIRHLENDRLDHMLSAIWEGAVSGDIKAVEAVLKIMTRRAKLLGLDVKAPHQIAVSTTWEPQDVDSEVQRIMRAFDRAEALGLDLFDE